MRSFGTRILIALGADLVIGTDTSNIAPPIVVNLHPAIRIWYFGKGDVHPAYYENQAEYNQLHPQNYEYAKKIVSDKESSQLLNHMQFRPDDPPQDYLVSRLFDFGLKGHSAFGSHTDVGTRQVNGPPESPFPRPSREHDSAPGGAWREGF